MKILYISVVLVTGLMYLNSLDNGFHYDDEHSIERNPAIRHLSNVPEFFVDTSHFAVDADKGMYRPLLLTTYALNYAWGGADPTGYHVMNVLIHSANACLVAWISTLLVGKRAAVAAAFLFALHPVCTEVVNYVSTRSESLAAFFYLLAVGAFVRWMQNGSAGWRWVCWWAFGFGLFTKSTAVTFPLVALIFDRLCRGCASSNNLREDVTVWRGHGALWAITAVYLIILVAVGFVGRSLALTPRGEIVQLLTQMKALSYYAKLLVLPVSLSVEPQFFEWQPHAWLTALTGGGGAAVLIWMAIRHRRDPTAFAVLWGALALLPVLIVPLNILVNEHRLYLTCAAFSIAIATYVPFSSTRSRIGWVAVLVVAGLLLFDRNRAWADHLTLWTRAVEVGPLMPRAHLHVGDAHRLRSEESTGVETSLEHRLAARAAYSHVLTLNPELHLRNRALTSLAILHYEDGDLWGAEANLTQVLDTAPAYADALVNLGNVYFRRAHESGAQTEMRASHFAKAADLYFQVLRVHPNRFEGHLNLGAVEQARGELEAAERSYRTALHLQPENGTALRNLGTLFIQRARTSSGAAAIENWQKARDHLLRAQGVQPTHVDIQRALAETEQMLWALTQDSR